MNEFWFGLLSNILATLVGVFLALKIDRSLAKKNETKYKNDILHATRDFLIRNDFLMFEIKTKIEEKPAVKLMFNLDLGFLESSSIKRWEIIDDFDLNHSIDNICFGLKKIDDTIDHIRIEENQNRRALLNTFVMNEIMGIEEMKRKPLHEYVKLAIKDIEEFVGISESDV